MAHLKRYTNITNMKSDCEFIRHYMTFSILALVLAQDSHIKPDSEDGGLISVEG